MTKKTAIKQKPARKQATGRPPEAAAPKKPPTKTARPAQRQPVDAQAAYQFDLTTAVPRIVATKARPGQTSAEFASFDDAKDRAIDFLIDFIADCERQLWDLKRAENYDTYAAFIAAEEGQRS